MPLTEHNWERFFQQDVERKEKIEHAISPEKIKEKADDKIKYDKEPPRKIMKILPKDAHRIALKLIANKYFKNKLKEFIAEIIVQGQNITRIDVIIEKGNDKQLLDLYGLTKEHFKNLTNGNLTSFDIAADGHELAIYFKRATGEPAIRPIDNNKLAMLLNLILNISPDLATDLRTYINMK